MSLPDGPKSPKIWQMLHWITMPFSFMRRCNDRYGDRFTAAIDRAADDKAVFTVAYVVRAVSPGKYVLPQAYVEDMYNPSRYGRSGTGSVEVRPAK